MSINILEGQTAPGLEREPEMNFNLNVQTFRLITEGYILVSDSQYSQNFDYTFFSSKGFGWTSGNIGQHFPDLCIF